MPDRDLLAEGRMRLAALGETPATHQVFDLAEWAVPHLPALLDELEELRRTLNAIVLERRNPDREVLVEGSWFHPEDLPKILGNYMRSVDEYGRRWKDAVVENKALRARIAELEAAQRPPLGYVSVSSSAPFDWSRVTLDRTQAVSDLADLTGDYPDEGWRLAELREVQP